MALQWSSRSPSVLSMKSPSLHCRPVWIGHSSCGALFFYTTSLSCQERRKLLLPCHFISFLPVSRPGRIQHSAHLSGVDWCFRWSLLFSQVYSQGLRNDPPHVVPWCATPASPYGQPGLRRLSLLASPARLSAVLHVVVWMVVTPVFILAWDDWTEDTSDLAWNISCMAFWRVAGSSVSPFVSEHRGRGLKSMTQNTQG